MGFVWSDCLGKDKHGDTESQRWESQEFSHRLTQIFTDMHRKGIAGNRDNQGDTKARRTDKLETI